MCAFRWAQIHKHTRLFAITTSDSIVIIDNKKNAFLKRFNGTIV